MDRFVKADEPWNTIDNGAEPVCSLVLDRPGLPARLFRALFRSRRPRGYMRLGTWMARAFTSMQTVRVPLDDELLVSLDLRKIDHQPVFLDGRVVGEEEERRLLKRLVPQAGTAIDVGANFGIHALTLARIVGPNGLVIAYEPAPDSLLLNVSALPQIIVRPFVVSDVEAEVGFRQERSTTLSRMVFEGEHTSCDVRVRSVRLDAEIARLRLPEVDFLKIDVEGLEDRVLRGAQRLLASSSPPVLCMEWIPGFRGRWKQSPLAVLREIVEPGWRLFRVGFGLPTVEILEFEEPTEEANIIAFPPCRSRALSEILGGLQSAATSVKA